MNITATTISLTVDDVAASRDFLTTHFGYQETHAADGFVSLTRGDAAADVVLLRRGIEVLPEDQRYQRATGLILAFTVTGIEAEHDRLLAEGATITMPLREEPWANDCSRSPTPTAWYCSSSSGTPSPEKRVCAVPVEPARRTRHPVSTTAGPRHAPS